MGTSCLCPRIRRYQLPWSDIKFSLDIMRQFEHPHIIRLIGIVTQNPIYLVMELAPYGEVKNWSSWFVPSESLQAVVLALVFVFAFGLFSSSKRFLIFKAVICSSFPATRVPTETSIPVRGWSAGDVHISNQHCPIVLRKQKLCAQVGDFHLWFVCRRMLSSSCTVFRWAICA